MEEDEKRVRIGIIGMGRIAEIHLGNLLRMRNVIVAAICDIETGKAAAAAGPIRANVYADWREMLRKEPLDGVLVCIPQFSRGEETAAIAEEGIPLFIEKPAAPTLDLAAKNLEAIRSSKIINAIGYMWRSSSCLDRMKSLIGDQEVGLIHGYSVSTAPYATWFWDKSRSGGQIFDQATHVINLAIAFGGEVDSVQATGTVGRLLSDDWVKSEDVSGVLLKFRDGTIGTFANTWAHEGKASECFSLSVFGRRFALTFEPFKNLLTGHVDEVAVHYEGPEETRFQELIDFVRAVRTGSQDHIRCSYEEGVRTLEVTLAANRALEERREVRP